MKNPHDEDTTLVVKKYFLRARGFTCFEVLMIAPNHEIFLEDRMLLMLRDHARKTINYLVNPLVTRACPEEESLGLQEKMNKAKVMAKFFEPQFRPRGTAPVGERTSFAQWAASPGADMTRRAPTRFILPDSPAPLQTDSSAQHVPTTHLMSLKRLQAQVPFPSPTRLP